MEFFGITANFRADFSKKGNFSQEEIALALEIFKTAYARLKDDPSVRLKRLGASIYGDSGHLDWSYIAGYEEVKRKIRESIILPLMNPDIYDSIAKMTRRSFESNRPRAILFEGGPGVGKTTIARIIAGEVKVPLVYVPIESIMSKWYGQSSQKPLADLRRLRGPWREHPLPRRDRLARRSRDQNMFEATRRVLSVLLRRLDGSTRWRAP